MRFQRKLDQITGKNSSVIKKREKKYPKIELLCLNELKTYQFEKYGVPNSSSQIARFMFVNKTDRNLLIYLMKKNLEVE